jgi:hypothetical protein
MIDAVTLLDYISPDDYKTWIDVGMALKNEGYSCTDWEQWSRKSSKYKDGECRKKWRSFANNGDLTAGTIVHYAEENGYISKKSNDNFLLGFDDYISAELPYNEQASLTEPAQWQPMRELRKYITTLFNDDDKINYVTASMENDGKFSPASKGVTKTVKSFLAEIDKHSDICDVIGDYNKQAGVWVRFNPMDGQGAGNANVTSFRYALVESDAMDIQSQYDIYKKLNLPAAALVYSGGKSLHAVVRINAKDKEEYSQRVQYLYDVCEKSGLVIDKNNKNPARLSRLPGAERNGKKQFIVDVNTGAKSFEEWKSKIENANIPEIESLSLEWETPPPLAPAVIDGVLRKGHKMMIAGASKAGKTFLLMELCIAFAEGEEWLGFGCVQGKVLYINLEVDRASCINRFHKIYDAMGIAHPNTQNIDIWNLRGHAKTLDSLVPDIVEKAKTKNYIAVVIDPIYKVLMGDENTASDMGKFCNQFDILCNELGCSVIYCHHHRKGDLSGSRAMDRASGSGVLARDGDALVDMIELEIPQSTRDRYFDELFRAEWRKCFEDGYPMDYEMCDTDELLTAEELTDEQRLRLTRLAAELKQDIESRTAWKVEMTLREFRGTKPFNIWFKYPLHMMDDTIEGLLKKEKKPTKETTQNANEKRADNKDSNVQRLKAYLDENNKVGTVWRVAELMKVLDVTRGTMYNYLKKLNINVTNGTFIYH